MSRRDSDMNNYDTTGKKHLHDGIWSTRPAHLQKYRSQEQHLEQVRERTQKYTDSYPGSRSQ